MLPEKPAWHQVSQDLISGDELEKMSKEDFDDACDRKICFCQNFS